GDAPSPDAFERMFERDKDTLRELGIPIVTVDAGGHADEVGYRIDQDAYALPAVDLTPAELGVLALAAQFWQDKTLRTDISRALTKLRAAGAGETAMEDRKSTRLNSSHVKISYAVFCLKKKTKRE